MKATAKDRITLTATGANLIRIVIASYFLALGAGVIPGTDVSALLSPVIPDPLAGLLSGALVFGLAYLVLVGVWLRPAALLLALVMFWASYISAAQAGFAPQLGSFWRDMALIAALILTYAETDPRARTRRSALRSLRAPRRLLTSGERVAPRRVFAPNAPKAAVIPFRPAAALLQLSRPAPAFTFASLRAQAQDDVGPVHSSPGSPRGSASGGAARSTATATARSVQRPSLPHGELNVFRDDFDIARTG
ncbi:hypothetical protein ACRDNQ_06225 [Palleronia sp. KMU-117]|uniref:hypothetical protein n=1 Tax=Palleronia sp. KMU-117 TaxID=3434108 RepID=UPI003D735B6D